MQMISRRLLFHSTVSNPVLVPIISIFLYGGFLFPRIGIFFLILSFFPPFWLAQALERPLLALVAWTLGISTKVGVTERESPLFGGTAERGPSESVVARLISGTFQALSGLVGKTEQDEKKTEKEKEKCIKWRDLACERGHVCI